MTKIVTYVCPGKKPHPSHQFDHLHHPSVEASPLPRFCPTCGYDSQGKVVQRALTAPHIQKPVKKATDDVYRGMEQGSEFRAQMAQEVGGLDAAEANALKITNMRDNARAGESSEIPVTNAVTQVMAAAPGVTGFQGANGLGYSGAVSTGPAPNAGAHAQAALRRQHAAFTAGSGMTGTATSNVPALETTQPGYRVRVA